MTAEKLQNILKNERKMHGYSQQKLSDILCITRGAYAKYETGDNIPPLEVMMKLADHYKLSLDYLTGRYEKRD